MSFICMFVVLHYNSGWLSADTLQAVDLGLTLIEALPCSACALLTRGYGYQTCT